MTSPALTTLLLVEDNASDLELTLRALKKHRLADQVHVVRDGAEALEFLFPKNPPSGAAPAMPKVILLDLKLPKVSGLEVLKRVKSDARTKTIPVVVLSSSHQEKDIAETYQLGVNSYVVKPVDFDQFGQAISQLGLYWLIHNQPPPSHAA